MGMLLTIDLGNTCIKFGLFDGDKQLSFNYIPTFDQDYRANILQFIYKAGVREEQVDDCIISSVVPTIKVKLVELVKTVFGFEPKEIDINKDHGINVAVENPQEVGQDLLVMCAYANAIYHRDLLICSLGTCSVLCHVDAEGSFKYCVIAPGFKKMAESLYSSSEQLSEFKIEKRESFLAANTVDAMNVGFYNGYIGMIEYLVSNMKQEIGKDLYVIACGGGSRDIAPYTACLDVAEPDFVTKGLNYLYNRYYHE